MKKGYTTKDGKLALLNTKSDECLCDNTWVNGRQQNRGTDLYVHKTKRGKLVFYEFNWTQWQGESSSITVLDEETIGIVAWVTERYSWFSEETLTRLEELGVKVEETA